MKIFPVKELRFKLIDDQNKSLDRLNSRTERSERLTPRITDKTFLGLIKGNEFKLITSSVGRGAFCVMTGIVEPENGKVRVEIHKVFQVLLSFILCLPILGMLVLIVTRVIAFSPILILVVIGQILMIRYLFIGLAFSYLSKESLSRLRDVIDFEWLKA